MEITSCLVASSCIVIMLAYAIVMIKESSKPLRLNSKVRDRRSIEAIGVLALSVILLMLSTNNIIDFTVMATAITVIMFKTVWESDSLERKVLLHVVSIAVVPLVMVYQQYVSYLYTFETLSLTLGKYQILIWSNYIIAVIVYCAILIISQSLNFAVIASQVISVGLAYVNTVLLTAREMSLQLGDLSAIGTASEVVSQYELTPNKGAMSAALAGLAMLVCFVSFRKHPEVDKGKRRRYMIFLNIVTLVIFCAMVPNLEHCSNKEYLKSNNIDPIAFRERYNGAFLNIVSQAVYGHVSTPNNWVELVREIDNNTNDNVDTFENLSWQSGHGYIPYNRNLEDMNCDFSFLDGEYGQPDNIVYILGESFEGVPSEAYGIGSNVEFTPYFSSMTENTIKGHTFVPAFMGGTANSEYEALTGQFMATYEALVYPYSAVLKGETPSIVNVMKSNGYSTLGIHNYYMKGYSRYKVWEWMGFDKKVFLEDMGETAKLNNYPLDTEVYDRIIENILNSEEKTFNFGVTVMCHGGAIELTPSDFEKYSLIDYEEPYSDKEYITFVKNAAKRKTILNYSDRLFGEFIEELKNIDENVLVIMFGDHQSTAWDTGNGVYYSEEACRGVTPFCIWANYDIPELTDVTFELAYMPAVITKISGLKLSNHYEWLLDTMKKYPVINPLLVANSDGKTTSITDFKTNSIYYKYIESLREASLKNPENSIFKVRDN